VSPIIIPFYGLKFALKQRLEEREGWVIGDRGDKCGFRFLVWSFSYYLNFDVALQFKKEGTRFTFEGAFSTASILRDFLPHIF